MGCPPLSAGDGDVQVTLPGGHSPTRDLLPLSRGAGGKVSCDARHEGGRSALVEPAERPPGITELIGHGVHAAWGIGAAQLPEEGLARLLRALDDDLHPPVVK